MVTFAFLHRFRDIFSLIAQISKTIEPTVTTRVPKALQSRKLHFCRKKSIFLSFCSFRQKHFENQAIDFASNFIGKSFTWWKSAGRWLRPVLLQTQCTTWEAVSMDFHKRVSGRKFIVCSKTEFFHFMFFADLLTSRVLLEALKSQRPLYLS